MKASYPRYNSNVEAPMNKKKTAEPEIVLTPEQIARYTKEVNEIKALSKKGPDALRKAGYLKKI
jgi:hypothetical protein